MTLTVLALWLLGGFGAIVFAATSIRGYWGLACGALGFGMGWLAVSPETPVSLEALGVLAALVAVAGLAWPRHWIITSMAAGVLAAVWGTTFALQGAPAPVALAAAAGFPLLSAWLALTRPVFAPPVLRDEALLIVFALGGVVAVAPGVSEGWRSAATLTIEPGRAAQAIPAWTLALSVAAFVLGGGYRLWRRG